VLTDLLSRRWEAPSPSRGSSSPGCAAAYASRGPLGAGEYGPAPGGLAGGPGLTLCRAPGRPAAGRVRQLDRSKRRKRMLGCSIVSGGSSTRGGHDVSPPPLAATPDELSRDVRRGSRRLAAIRHHHRFEIRAGLLQTSSPPRVPTEAYLRV